MIADLLTGGCRKNKHMPNRLLVENATCRFYQFKKENSSHSVPLQRPGKEKFCGTGLT